MSKIMSKEKMHHEWREGAKRITGTPENGDWQLLLVDEDGTYDCLGHLCWKDEQWRWFESMGGSCFDSRDFAEIAKKMAEMESKVTKD